MPPPEPKAPAQTAATGSTGSAPLIPGGQSLLWQGMWADPVTGLYMTRNRVYDPRTASFLSPDPADDWDSPNLYGFARNRPHELTDPLGLAVKKTKEVLPAQRPTFSLSPTSRSAMSLNLETERLLPEAQVEVSSATSTLDPLADLRQLYEIGLGDSDAMAVLSRMYPGNARQNLAVSSIGQTILPFAPIAEGMYLFASLFVMPPFAPRGPLPGMGLLGEIHLAPMAGASAPAGGATASSRSLLPVLNPHFVPDPQGILQNLTRMENARLIENPSLAATVLRPAEFKAAQESARIAPMAWGNTVERLVRDRVRENEFYSSILQHVGGPRQPDFIGVGQFAGMNLDITTTGQVGAHLQRPGYGLGLKVITYERPPGFRLFPQP